MMFINENWFWKNFPAKAEIASTQFPDFLAQKLTLAKIPFTDNHSIIWSQISHFEYDYDNAKIEDIILDGLLHSSIMDCEALFIDYGYNGPILKVPTSFFVTHWKEIVRSAFYETCVISTDMKYVMEFSQNPYKLYSNFSLYE